MRVLHVDDSRTILAMVSHILTAAGMEVVSVSVPTEAVGVAQHQAFDVIITDIMMPGMDGVELVKALRKQPETALLPVIVCSTVQQRDLIAEAIKAGIQDYMVKPIDGKKLIAKVTQLAEMAKAPAAPDVDGAMEQLGVPGDRTFYAEVLRRFINEANGDLGQLFDVISEKDKGLISIVATRIEGAASNLGADAVAHAAHALDEAGRAGDFEAALRHWAQLQAHVTRLSLFADSL